MARAIHHTFAEEVLTLSRNTPEAAPPCSVPVCWGGWEAGGLACALTYRNPQPFPSTARFCQGRNVQSLFPRNNTEVAFASAPPQRQHERLLHDLFLDRLTLASAALLSRPRLAAGWCFSTYLPL